MTETPNLGLSQWSLDDLIKMADFNSDNLKIDNFGRLNSGLGNEYVWAKETQETNIIYTETYEAAGNVFSPSSYDQEKTFYYSETISVSVATAVLENPKSVTVTTSNANDLLVLKGKYYTQESSGKGTVMYYIPANGTITVSNNGWNVTATKYTRTNFSENTVITNHGYVNSPDPNAYPPAVSDGFIYTAMGQIGEKVLIATGSYTGTGTYGSNNPNSLTFDFNPKVLFLWGNPGAYGNSNLSSPIFYMLSSQGSISGITCSFLGNTVLWYADAASSQANMSGQPCHYLAIG